MLKALLPAVLLAVCATSAWAKFERAVYYDSRVDTNWWDASMAQATRDFFVGKGYTEVNGETSVQWMKDRIADHSRSVLVMAMDVITNQMGATADGKPDPNSIMRQYLNAGGKIVWIGDWPFYGHRDLTAAARSTDGWAGTGANVILGINGSDKGDINKPVQITDAGKAWGLTQAWLSRRAVNNATANVILAAGDATTASGWHRYYSFAGPASGFTRIFDVTVGDLPEKKVTEAVNNDILAVAEFPADAPDTVPPTTLTGSLKDAKGNPMVNTSFNVVNAEGVTLAARTDAEGKFSIAAVPGEYSITFKGEELDPSTQTTKITVAGTVPSDTNIVVGATPAFEVNANNSTGKVSPTATARDLGPAQAGFDDSAWTDLKLGSKNTPTQPRVRAFWQRVKFDAPADYPAGDAAVVYNLTVDDRAWGVWLNGVPLGGNRGGSPGAMVVPANTLKATGNVLSLLGWNTGGPMGIGGPFRVHALQKQGSGAIRVVVAGTPLDQGGTAQGVLVSLVGADGKEIANQTTEVQGIASFTQVPSGAYTARLSGPIVDGPVEKAVTVADGAVTQVDQAALGAIGLGTIYLPADTTWRAKPAVDQNDANLWAPGFDDSAWNPIPVSLDLKSGDRGTPDVFADNEWDAARLKFKVPAEWQGANRYLVLDSFQVDDLDHTYLNGVLLGSIGQWDQTRSYPLPPELVNFGGDNQLTVVWNNGTGGTGIHSASNNVRLRQANNSQAFVWGTITGADDKPVGAGVSALAVSADGTSATTSTLLSGQFGLQVAPGNVTVGTAGASQSAAVTTVGGQSARADLKIDATQGSLVLTNDHGFQWKIWVGKQVTGNELLFVKNVDESQFRDFEVRDDVGKAGNWDVVDPTDNIYGWLRLTLRPDQIPEEWKTKFAGKSLVFGGYAFDDVDEVYFNGIKIGKLGTFPSDPEGFKDGPWNAIRNFVVPAKAVDLNGTNVIAIKGFDGGGGGAFNGGPPKLSVLGVATGPATVAKGDVDFNGKTDVADVRALIRLFAGGAQPAGEQLTAADVNGNGAVDLGDLVLILKAAVLGTPLP